MMKVNLDRHGSTAAEQKTTSNGEGIKDRSADM